VESRQTENEPITYIEIVPGDDPFGEFPSEPLVREVRPARTGRVLHVLRTVFAVRLIGVAVLSSLVTAAGWLMFRGQAPAPGRLAPRTAAHAAAHAPAAPGGFREVHASPSIGHISSAPTPPPAPARSEPLPAVPFDMTPPEVRAAGESERLAAAEGSASRPASLAVESPESRVPGGLPGAASAPTILAALGAPPSAAPAPVAEARPVATPTAAIESVLGRYASSFNALDARGAKAVWPAVNERGLARAFDSLEQQQLDLGDCNITVASARATASCDGIARYVPKVGSRRMRAERRQWTFLLQRDGPDWSIENVDIRLP
jgi:hypothetical protein